MQGNTRAKDISVYFLDLQHLRAWRRIKIKRHVFKVKHGQPQISSIKKRETTHRETGPIQAPT